MKPLSTLQQQDARDLAGGYTPAIRRMEIASIVAFFVVLVALACKLWPWLVRSPWLLLAALSSGYLAADVISGTVHWLADTWGRTDMPVLGKTLLRPFREHHVDPLAITRHDFIETNGNNCLVSVGPLFAVLFLPQAHDKPFNLFFAAFLGSSALWVLATNQFHKWAHMASPPPGVSTLQRLHLILPPEHHAIHHTAPFNRYYCITVGWMNWPLHVVRFFPTLELLITWATGALPRADDIGERAALEIAPTLETGEAELTPSPKGF
jgi:hypothetical protein